MSNSQYNSCIDNHSSYLIWCIMHRCNMYTWTIFPAECSFLTPRKLISCQITTSYFYNQYISFVIWFAKAMANMQPTNVVVLMFLKVWTGLQYIFLVTSKVFGTVHILVLSLVKMNIRWCNVVFTIQLTTGDCHKNLCGSHEHSNCIVGWMNWHAYRLLQPWPFSACTGLWEDTCTAFKNPSR